MTKDGDAHIGQITEQEAGERPTLKYVFQTVTFAPNRAISDNIREIELQVFGEEADQLLAASLDDPEGRERGSLVYITPQRQVFLQRQPTIGTPNHVHYELRVSQHDSPYTVQKEQRQNRFMATAIHSHGHSDDTFSEVDIMPLFLGDYETNALTAAFVINTEEKALLFRGRKTPQLTEPDAIALRMKWKNTLSERVKQYKVSTPSHEQSQTVLDSFRRTMLGQIARKYDLRYYACPIGENIARRRTF